MLATTEEKSSYVSRFERLDGEGPLSSPAWLRAIRRSAFAKFDTLGFPTTRHEEWRYTSVASIARTQFAVGGELVPADLDLSDYTFCEDVCNRLVFVDGRFSAEHSNIVPSTRGVRITNLAQAFDTDPTTVESHLAQHACYENQAFTALNTAMMEDGAFIYVPKGVVVDHPIHVLYWSTAPGEPAACFPRNLIVADVSSQVTLVETYAGSPRSAYFTNAVTELVARDNAVINHYKLGREGVRAYHVGHLQVHQSRDSDVTSQVFTFGGSLVRNDIGAVLDGEGARCTLNGLHMIGGTQHVDNHLRVEHAKPRCDSRELFKGILDGKSRGVFTGRIIVREDAQKTDGKQTNQNLLLSDDAMAYSKPQLEIFADDVKCTHGATIGQVDKDALFYLQSRGLCMETARSVLVYAFASESVGLVKMEPLRKQIERLLFECLPQGHRLADAL